MKKLIKLFTNKIILTAIGFLIEVMILVLFTLYLSYLSIWVYIALKVLSVIVAIAVISRDANPAYKLALVVPMLTFSLIGGILYLNMGRSRLPRRNRKMLKRNLETMHSLLKETDHAVGITAPSDDPSFEKLSRYITAESHYPLYSADTVEYFPSGEQYVNALEAALLSAEKFIFLEYFVIGTGKLWDRLSAILLEKVCQGVDVRIIYDDVGSLFSLPPKEKKRLKRGGIKLLGFNKLTPSFDIRLNNRSHRKIAVIDGRVAFTGGVNLADEYVNYIERCGHWKDTGIKVTGLAVWSFTVMFLSFWSTDPKNTVGDFAAFAPTLTNTQSGGGYIQPFSDMTGANLQLTENVLLQMIHTAQRYIYINTPYLILDNELTQALCLASKSGIDVRLTVPHIPDKRTVFMMTRSFYPPLIAAGVKIYEYTPGFIHAKSIVCDDKIAYIGTCNLDYRSLYLHYECGALLYACPCIADMSKDFLKTLESAQEVPLEKARGANVLVRLARSILRIFAPLL